MRKLPDNIYTNYKNILLISGCSFFILFFYSIICGYKEEITSLMLAFQMLIGLSFLFFIFLTLKIKNINQLLFTIFIYSFTLSFLLRLFYFDVYNRPYGLAVDSYTYDNIGQAVLNFSESKVIEYLNSYYDFDDFGYSLFVIVNFKIFGIEFGRWVILILNSAAITFSSFLFYHISIRILHNQKLTMIATGMWGFFPFNFVTASVGLKENIFCVVIMCFWYYAYKYFSNKTIPNLIVALIFVALTFAFRKAITLMLLICLLLMVFLNENNKRIFLHIIILGGVISPFIAAFIIEAFTGISLEHVMAVTETRNNTMGESTPATYVQILGAIFGPFPNFTRLVQYGLYHSSGLLFKSLCSVFMLGGIYYMAKKLSYIFFPIALYLIFGFAMLIIGGVALDMRYAVTFYMAFIIMACYGIRMIRNKWIICITQNLSIAIILLYNLR